ncbi:MAG: glycosyl hydrolase, partial [Bacteroidota bacterium]|nr:glycosyl hydrolase [Bacteroidota bacterium]
FDFIDEQALSSFTTVKDGELINLSGQGYRTVIIPPLSVISEEAVAKLKLFAQAGGKVVFLGHIPELLAGKTFVHAANFEKPEWPIILPSTELTPALLSELPQPDFSPVSVCPSVKYLHRRWKDADLYFFFNESDKEISTEANLSADGPLQDWNATSGKIDMIPFDRYGNHSARFHLKLGPWETKFVVAAMK